MRIVRIKFPKGKNVEYVKVIVEFFNHEDYYIYGRNPQLPEESIMQASGEILMKEESYRVGGVQNFPAQVLS